MNMNPIKKMQILRKKGENSKIRWKSIVLGQINESILFFKYQFINTQNLLSKNHSISTCLRPHISIKKRTNLPQQRSHCNPIIEQPQRSQHRFRKHIKRTQCIYSQQYHIFKPWIAQYKSNAIFTEELRDVSDDITKLEDCSKHLNDVIYYPRFTCVLIVVFTHEILQILLLGGSGLESSEEDEDFLSAGGAIDRSVGVGLNVSSEALAWVRRGVPQKLWLQVATTSSTILSMQMKHSVLIGSPPSKGLSWEEDRSLPSRGVMSPSMPKQPAAHMHMKKRKRKREMTPNASKILPTISILFSRSQNIQVMQLINFKRGDVWEGLGDENIQGKGQPLILELIDWGSVNYGKKYVQMGFCQCNISRIHQQKEGKQNKMFYDQFVEVFMKEFNQS